MSRNNPYKIPHTMSRVTYHTPHTKSGVKGDGPQCIHTQSMDSSAKNVLKPTMHCNVEFITFLLYPPLQYLAGYYHINDGYLVDTKNK